MEKQCTIWLKDYDLVYARKEIKRPSTFQSVSQTKPLLLIMLLFILDDIDY